MASKIDDRISLIDGVSVPKTGESVLPDAPSDVSGNLPAAGNVTMDSSVLSDLPESTTAAVEAANVGDMLSSPLQIVASGTQAVSNQIAVEGGQLAA